MRSVDEAQSVKPVLQECIETAQVLVVQQTGLEMNCGRSRTTLVNDGDSNRLDERGKKAVT